MMVDVIRKEIVDRFGVKIKNEIFILGYVQKIFLDIFKGEVYFRVLCLRVDFYLLFERGFRILVVLLLNVEKVKV